MSKPFTPAAAPSSQEIAALLREARALRAQTVAATFAALGQRLRGLFGANPAAVQKDQNRAV